MLKIRMQGTPRDIDWFKRHLRKHEEIELQEISEIFPNKGTNRYFRAYAEVERKRNREGRED